MAYTTMITAGNFISFHEFAQKSYRFKRENIFKIGQDLKKSVNKVKLKTVNIFSSYSGYVPIIFRLSSASINILVNSGEWIEPHKEILLSLKNAASYLRYLAIIRVPKAIASLPIKLKLLRQAIHLKDPEEIFLSGLTCSMTIGEIFRSTMGAAETIVFLAANTSIKGISIFSSLSTVLMGGHVINKCHRLYHLKKFKLDLEQHLCDRQRLMSSVTSRVALKVFLDQHLEEDIKRTKEFKAAVLQRNTNDSIANKLNDISKLMLQSELMTSENAEQIVHTFKQIQVDIRKESLNQASSLFTGTITCIALAMLHSPILPIIPSSLLAASALMQLISKLYQDKKSVPINHLTTFK